jgi:hypothetical protein
MAEIKNNLDREELKLQASILLHSLLARRELLWRGDIEVIEKKIQMIFQSYEQEIKALQREVYLAGCGHTAVED